MSEDSDRHALRRRPLLSPVIVVGAAVAIALIVAGWFAVGLYQEPGTVILTRHAEKSTESGDDPGLSATGAQRAVRLAGMFADTGVDAVFSSHLQRSIATAGPLANRLSLPVYVYDAPDTGALVERIDAEHRDETVFVVGHSNTVPAMARALSGRPVMDIDEERYGDVFVIIRPRWGRASVVHYRVPGP